METEERKLKQMQSQRVKELERLKSLAVVSVLNKNFEEHTRPSSLLLNLSPSNSLTTENIRENKTRSNSNSSTRTYTTLNNDNLTNSPIDAEKEDLEKRLSELEALYASSIEQVDALKHKSDQQTELLILQDKLILQLSNDLSIQDQHEPSVESNVDPDTLLTSQKEIANIVEELSELRLAKSQYESTLTQILAELDSSNEKIHQMESIAQEVQKENSENTEYIDSKLQTLLNKILHKNEIISRLQQENQQQEKEISLMKTIKKSTSNKSLNLDEDDKTNSARSSIVDSSRRSRLKSPVFPPASPPPSLPLPPIPSSSTSKSILSELSKGSTIDTKRTASIHSTEIEAVFDEAAYYKEFTDQLQERLSMSKEIDELKVWEPSDFEAIQRKIDSETWSIDEDGHKDQHAFWKGMKKRLRV